MRVEGGLEGDRCAGERKEDVQGMRGEMKGAESEERGRTFKRQRKEDLRERGVQKGNSSDMRWNNHGSLI